MNIRPLDAAIVRPWEGGATFSMANRLYRVVFAVTWFVLASWTPPQMRAWRRWLLRRFGARIAATANVYGSVRIWFPANLTLEDYATLGPGVTVYSMAPIAVRSHAIVSQGAHLCAGTHDIECKHFQLKSRPIEIQSRAWVAAEAFVGPGVIVGEGAVLGARGCSFRNLEPWTVYIGNPATIQRQRRVRFDETAAQQAAGTTQMNATK